MPRKALPELVTLKIFHQVTKPFTFQQSFKLNIIKLKLFYALGIEYSVNRLGSTCLLIEGYRFRQEYKSGLRVSWRCSTRGCPATAVTIDRALHATRYRHTHFRGQSVNLQHLQELVDN